MLAPATASKQELELKLELPAEDMKRLRASPLLSADAGAEARRTLTSVYFDTPDFRLRQEGVALRLRNEGGDAWIQTVKSDATLQAGLSKAQETETLLAACKPDLESIGDDELRRRIKKILKRKAIDPVFETAVERTVHRLTKGECVAELALDVGRVSAAGKKRQLREVELELISGSARDFLAIATELFSELNVRPSPYNKATRGYRLAKGEADAIEPFRGGPVELSKSQPAREAFATILGAAAQQIAMNQRAILETGSSEGVHQMRVGLTRLRSALRSFGPYAGASWIGELEADAQSLCRTVGHLRDADVLIEDIYAPVAEDATHVPGFPQLLEALKAHREATHKEVRPSLAKGVWPRLLFTVALGPHLLDQGGAPDEAIEAIAGEIMETRWKKVRNYGERLAGLDLEERHSMRKAMKKLRYNAEFFQSLYGKRAQTFIERLKKMQQLFGVINDVRMAHRLIDISLEACGRNGAPLAAAGYILGRHEAHAPLVWRKAKREWKRFEETAGFWR